MSSEIRRRVEQFATALSFALLDRELELRGSPIIHYHDADVIFKMVMGLEAELLRPSGSSEKMLVRALLSCGFLQDFHIHMLRPHAFELNEKLRGQPQFLTKRDENVFLGKARNFLRSKRIWDTMSELYSIVTANAGSASEDEDMRVERFLAVLRRSPGDTFAYIEQTHGTWWQRLRRYQDKDLLCLDNLGPEIQELLDSKEKVIREINAILRRKRPKYTINVFQDAVALTILHEKVRARDEGRSNEMVRFYTETASMRMEISENDTLRDLLSYQRRFGTDMHIPPGAQLVLRDSRYYIMRAWFQELAWGAPAAGLDTLRELWNLSDKLQGLLKVPEQHLEQAINGIEHSGKGLNDLLEDFEKLAIMDSVWTSGRIPSDLRELEVLKRWTKVFEFAERPSTDELVFEQIEDVWAQLDSSVSKMRTWMRDFKRILRASKNRRTAQGRIEDLMRDLGLVRWGYSLSDDEKKRLVVVLTSLLQEDDIDLSMEASKVATLIEESRYDVRQCLVACAILWALGCFEDIVQLANECGLRSGCKRLPPSLEVIQAAAEVRTGRLSTHEERQKIVDRLWRLQKGLPEEQRTAILLGVGYVIYHAWKLEWIASGLGAHEAHKLDPEIQKCAQRSFSLGEQAFRLLPANQLAWAYSVNHCAYIGIVAGVEPEKTEDYFTKLVRLESLPSLWNARFADTVGCYYLFEALREWHETSPEHRTQLDLSNNLESARNYFDKAKASDIGDIDIDEHVNWLNVLENNYKRLKGPLGEQEGSGAGIDGD